MGSDDWRALRARHEKLISRFELPYPFRVEDLCTAVAEERGRPLQLLPMPAGLAADAGVCGMWVSFGTSDLVYYTAVTSRPHQTHIILHELAHILLDHREPSVPEPAMLAQLFPDLDPAMAARLLGRGGRTHATEHQEQEAELLASVMWQHFNAAPVAVPTAAPDTAHTLSRVMGAFSRSTAPRFR
ncbi:hypothetical protein [Streptomyces bambusae]|uniref:IrrE N-terminal-like domain-containing protein n=1 Tax=Streptomyces bambusae TaxID=1550616 RepID=A0ABS6Z509_9ACTN|nr:hypothetical protein [Streptomyces bambusae]MBW5482858.1 hypothetical protein [Streptomyces bambusae]